MVLVYFSQTVSSLISFMHTALEKVEQKIVKKGALPEKPRPWVDSPAVGALTKTVLDVVEFPDEEESTGSVTIAWHGTKFTDFLEEAALSVVEEYLTQSAVALLMKEVVCIYVLLLLQSFTITDIYSS